LPILLPFGDDPQQEEEDDEEEEEETHTHTRKLLLVRYGRCFFSLRSAAAAVG
jgi:hypothetical protein